MLEEADNTKSKMDRPDSSRKLPTHIYQVHSFFPLLPSQALKAVSSIGGEIILEYEEALP